MSIFASTLAFDADDHRLGCAYYIERESGIFELSGKPCDCRAQWDQPILYRGSHVYPNPDDRGGSFDLGTIPGHIAESGGFDERHEHGCHRPFLRVGVTDPFGGRYPEAAAPPSTADVVLDERQVGELRDYLTSWLEDITGKGCPA